MVMKDLRHTNGPAFLEYIYNVVKIEHNAPAGKQIEGFIYEGFKSGRCVGYAKFEYTTFKTAIPDLKRPLGLSSP